MTLAERLARAMAAHGTESKKMFGGVCYLLNGNMLLGTLKDGLLVRVGKEAHAAAMRRPGARVFDMTGRVSEGFISVAADAVENDAALEAWIDLALAFNRTLPPKAAKARAAKGPAHRSKA